MTNIAAHTSDNRSPQPLWVVSDDPIFRLGLVTALAALQRFTVTENCDRATFTTQLSTPSDVAQVWIILAGQLELADLEGLREQLNPRQVLVITEFDLTEQAAAANLGFAYYCPPGSSLEAIAALLLQMLEGEVNSVPLPRRSRPVLEPSLNFPQAPPRWLYNLRRSGLLQIEENLKTIDSHLGNPHHSQLDQLFWQGRSRELRVARWLVNQLLPVQVILTPAVSPKTPESEAVAIVPTPESSLSLTQTVLADFLARAQQGTNNATGGVMAIDILQPPKRQELIYLIVEQFEQWLEQSQFVELTAIDLREQQQEILQELWQRITLEWLRRYYPIAQNPEQATLVVSKPPQAIAHTLPFVSELWIYLLQELPLTIDGVPYRRESPEAQERAAWFLDHVVVELANNVTEFLLNQYGEIEPVKQHLYRRNFFATRELTRFRNELSWRDRQIAVFLEPIAIFESRYELWRLSQGKITTQTLYAPRLAELQALEGIPWLVTMVLELRDALAPRVRSLLAIVGQGVVYLLTQVVGRALGLIGRGIAQGLGNSLTDTPYGRKGHNSRS